MLTVSRYFVVQLFINGEFVDSLSGKTYVNINPSNGKKLCDVAEGDKVILDFLFLTTWTRKSTFGLFIGRRRSCCSSRQTGNSIETN